MRASILFILIVLMNTSTLFGQKVSIGSEFGFISSINTDYKVTDIENRRTSYYAGVNLHYSINEKLSLTSGLHYLRQGYRHQTCYVFEEGVKNQLVGKFDYLTLPLTANIHIGKAKKLLVSFGVFGTYNIKAVQDYPEPIGGCEIYYATDLSESTRNYGIGGIAGIGYKIFENDHFQINSMVKYYKGLSNTFNKPNFVIDLDINRKYSSALLSFSINYKIE